MFEFLLHSHPYSIFCGHKRTKERTDGQMTSVLSKEKTNNSKDAPLAQLVEQLTLNQWVRGSSPRRCTKRIEGNATHSPLPFCRPSSALDPPRFCGAKRNDLRQHRTLEFYEWAQIWVQSPRKKEPDLANKSGSFQLYSPSASDIALRAA